jgi:nucleoside phosphorylase
MSNRFKTVSGASKVECSIDFVLVVAVPVEQNAVLALLEPVDDGGAALKVFEGETVYYVGRLGLYTCALVMCQIGSTGRDSSILATSAAIETWKPAGGVIMPGIAFGRHTPPLDHDPLTDAKQLIGDVLVATQVVPYEPARMGISEHVSRGAHPEPSLLLVNRLRNLDWSWTPSGDASTAPRGLQFGPVLSGEKLVDDPSFKQRLFEEFPKAIGGEMEGAGVYAASSRAHAHWIVVKAICDWGDGSKTKEFQPLAARNAAAVVQAVLSEPGLVAGNARRDDAVEALMRSKIELIRRADEVRQSKSEALGRLLGSYPPSEDGQISVPETLKTAIALMVKEREVALEQWLNAYEDACGEFVAGHIKSTLFQASLGAEVRELLEIKGPHHERLLPREKSPYRSIHAAYDLLRATDVKAQK